MPSDQQGPWLQGSLRFCVLRSGRGKWYKSVQLFFYLDSGAKSGKQRWYYGFSVWPDVSKRHLAKLNVAIEQSADLIAEYFRHAPTGTRVDIDSDAGEMELSPADFAACLAPRHGGTSGCPGTCYGMTVKREFRLRSLTNPAHAQHLVEEVGSFFCWAWPLFEASRTGEWDSKRPPEPKVQEGQSK